MTSFVQGVLAMYAACGVVSFLIFVGMLPQAERRGPSEIAKALVILVSGPGTGWLFLWGSIQDRIQRRERNKLIKQQLDGLLAELEQAAEQAKKSTPQPAYTNPHFDRHLWN